jgi:hypothetical protein
MQSPVMQMPARKAAGQVIERPFIRIEFQSGLPREVGVNGCRVEDVLEAALDRLNMYQRGPLACAENEAAVRSVRDAIHALDLRIRRRQEQGVLNTMARHETVRTEDEEHDFSATGA